jgi:glucokinase
LRQAGGKAGADVSNTIGVDLGGTNIKLLSVSAAGDLLGRLAVPTDDVLSGWAGKICEQVENLRRAHGPAARIGLAAPGLAARDGRSIAFMPGRLRGLENLDWTRCLNAERSVPVLNDAHAALLGEVWQGAGKGSRNAIMLTLGTGVGGAVFMDGRLLTGHIGRAGHLGHLCLDPDAAPDVVGIPGSLEDAIGECTLPARSKGAFASTRELVQAAVKGDAFARSVWDRSVYLLACGVASLVNILDPEIVIIGGGIAKAGEALFDPLARHLARIEWRPQGHRVKIVAAGLGDWAGAFGAAWHAMQQQTC